MQPQGTLQGRGKGEQWGDNGKTNVGKTLDVSETSAPEGYLGRVARVRPQAAVPSEDVTQECPDSLE